MSEQLGQHALIDSNVIKSMVDLAKLKPSDSVIDIGAGAGAITAALLIEPVHQVIAVEVDRNYAPRLLAFLKQHPNRLSVIFGDALRSLENEKYNKIVANVPFHLSEPLLQVVIKRKIDCGVFVFGEAFWAVIGAQTRLGVTTRLLYDIKKEFVVPRDSFDPAPRTDAIVVSLIKRTESLSLQESVLRETLLQSDKLLKNALESAIKEVCEISKKDAHEFSLKLGPLDLLEKRIQHLSNAQFARFIEYYSANVVTLESKK